MTYAIVTKSDIPRARQFFTEKLGLGTEDDDETFSQFTTRAGAAWAIMGLPSYAMGPGVELYPAVENVDAAYALWKRRGVEMVTEPHDEPFGRTFAFRDSDGRVMHAWRHNESRCSVSRETGPSTSALSV